MRAYSRLVVPLVFLAACGGSSESPETTAMVEPPAAPAPVAEAVGTREIDAGETEAMLEVLRADGSTDKRIVLIVSPGSPETVTLGAALETVFREAGWQPSTQRLTGMVLKPGPLRILVGDELEPSQVDSARRGLEAGGLTVETGTGYRAFYEEKKRENPNWPGIPMTAEQAFVVVIAPPPPAA
jgi:hypothetical protein